MYFQGIMASIHCLQLTENNNNNNKDNSSQISKNTKEMSSSLEITQGWLAKGKLWF